MQESRKSIEERTKLYQKSKSEVTPLTALSQFKNAGYRVIDVINQNSIDDEELLPISLKDQSKRKHSSKKRPAIESDVVINDLFIPTKSSLTRRPSFGWIKAEKCSLNEYNFKHCSDVEGKTDTEQESKDQVVNYDSKQASKQNSKITSEKKSNQANCPTQLQKISPLQPCPLILDDCEAELVCSSQTTVNSSPEKLRHSDVDSLVSCHEYSDQIVENNNLDRCSYLSNFSRISNCLENISSHVVHGKVLYINSKRL